MISETFQCLDAGMQLSPVDKRFISSILFLQRPDASELAYSSVAQTLPAYRSFSVLRAATARSDFLTSTQSLLR